MSAEVLREAASLMRVANTSAFDGHEDDFMLAVADWLNSEADSFDAHLAKQADPERRFANIWIAAATTRHTHAIAVARAYIGGAA
jgi:hypothetical protein